MNRIYGFKIATRGIYQRLNIENFMVVSETETTLKIINELGEVRYIFKHEINSAIFNLEVFNAYSDSKEKAIELTKDYLKKQINEKRQDIERKILLLYGISKL